MTRINYCNPLESYYVGVRGVNGTFLAVNPTRIVFDKAGMGKVFFSLTYRVWVWVRIFFR